MASTGQFEKKATDTAKEYIYIQRSKPEPPTYDQIKLDLLDMFGVDLSTSRISQIYTALKKKAERGKSSISEPVASREFTTQWTPPAQTIKDSNSTEPLTASDFDEQLEGPLNLEAILRVNGLKAQKIKQVIETWNISQDQTAGGLAQVLQVCQIGYGQQTPIIAQAFGMDAVRDHTILASKTAQSKSIPVAQAGQLLFQQRLASLKNKLQAADLQDTLDALEERREKGEDLSKLLKDIFAIEAIGRTKSQPAQDNMSNLMEKMLLKQFEQEGNSLTNAIQLINTLKKEDKGDSQFMQMLMEDRKQAQAQLMGLQSKFETTLETMQQENYQMKVTMLENKVNESLKNSVSTMEDWDNRMLHYVDMAKRMGYVNESAGNTEADAALQRLKILEKSADNLPDKVDVGLEKIEKSFNNGLDKVANMVLRYMELQEQRDTRTFYMQNSPQPYGTGSNTYNPPMGQRQRRTTGELNQAINGIDINLESIEKARKLKAKMQEFNGN